MNADQERALIGISAYGIYTDTTDQRFLLKRKLIELTATPAVYAAGGRRYVRLTDAGRIRLSDILTRRISNLSPAPTIDGDNRGQSGTIAQASEEKGKSE